MAFQQAQIPVQKTEEFEQLKSVIERVFAADRVEKLLKRVESCNLHIRQFELLLDKAVFERVDSGLARSGRTAKELYSALALSDRALIREFYLERIEKVDSGVRERFQKVYRYY
jgi:hypothetical protein